MYNEFTGEIIRFETRRKRIAMKRSILLALMLCYFSACTPAQVTPLAQISATSLRDPTHTAIQPTLTLLPSTSTSVPTLTLPALWGTPYPQPVESISPETAPRVTMLALWDHPTNIDPGAVISISPDGTRLATHNGSKVFIWDLANGSSLQVFDSGGGAAFSPDWSLLATRLPGSPFTALLWDLASGKLLHTMSQNNTEWISGMVFSPDGQILVQTAYGSNNLLYLWKTADGSLLRVIQGDDPLSGYAIAFSTDGKTLATTDLRWDEGVETTYFPEAYIQFWDVASGARLGLLRIGKYDVNFPSPERWGHNDNDRRIDYLTFSPDGNTLAVIQYLDISIWDWRNRIQLQKPANHTMADHLAFSPDGTTLAEGGWLSGVRLLEVSTGMELPEREHRNLDTTGLVFSPDGRLLVSSSENGTLMIWGVEP